MPVYDETLDADQYEQVLSDQMDRHYIKLRSPPKWLNDRRSDANVMRDACLAAMYDGRRTRGAEAYRQQLNDVGYDLHEVLGWIKNAKVPSFLEAMNTVSGWGLVQHLRWAVYTLLKST